MLKIFFLLIALFSQVACAKSSTTEQSQIESCSSKTDEILFYKGMVYHIIYDANTKTFNPLGSIGPTIKETSLIWQTSAPWNSVLASNYLLKSGYTLVKNNEGLTLVDGLSVSISKDKCRFSNSTNSFKEAWDCKATLSEPFNRSSRIEIKSNGKNLALKLGNLEVLSGDLIHYNRGFTSKKNKAVLAWMDEHNFYLSTGNLHKYKGCHDTDSKNYPSYIVDQVTGDDQFPKKILSK